MKMTEKLYLILAAVISITLFTSFGAPSSYGHGGRILEYPEVEPSEKAFVEFMCHVEEYGDTNFFKQPLSCGTTGKSKRLEGFMVRLGTGSDNVGLSYMAHIEGNGDTGWKHLNEYVGTKGKKRRLEEFAVKVLGEAKNKYDVYYMAHIAETGDTGWFRNGQYCGTKGKSRRVEAISIFLADKNAPKTPPQ